MDINRLCSTAEFARLIGVTPGYVRLLVATGQLPCVRAAHLGNRTLVERSLASKWEKPRGGRPRISAPKKKRKKRKAA